MSFFVTGGTLGPNAPSYVERQADRELFDALLQGEFCYVLTSRQMGKSSLMLRAAKQLEACHVKVATLDLTAIGAHDVTPEQWSYGVLDLLGEALDLREPLENFWRQNHKLGPIQRLMTAIREVLLPIQTQRQTQEDSPAAASPSRMQSSRVRLVIFLDEIDIVRSLGFSVDGFFAAIRECYNRRAQDPAYESLAFCLLGVATPTDLIRDARRTPFNIGRRIELNDFKPDEAEALIPGLVTEQLDSGSARLVLERILHWTGGHPYLTQRLCQETAHVLRSALALEPPRRGSPIKRAIPLVDQVCAELFLSHHALRRDPNLNFVSEHLLRNEMDRASLLDLYRKVRSRHPVPDDELDRLANQLRLAGIVRACDGRLVVRNRIYAHVFDREWIRANMPAAELRRQRAAFRHGVVLATTICLLLLAVLSGLTGFALVAFARASFSEAKSQRTSGRSGQRIASLAALNSARPFFRDVAKLRYEATAALSLMDLSEGRSWTGKVTAVSASLSVGAQVESDGSVRLFNPSDGADLGRLPQLNPPPCRLRFSPDGSVLLVEQEAGSGGRLTVWNWAHAQQLFPSLNHAIESRAVDFTPDGRKLAIGTTDGTIEIYSLPSGTRERPLSLEMLPIGIPRIPDVVRFSPSGELLAESCSDDRGVQIWQLADRKPLGEPLVHTARVHDIAWGDGGRLLGVACGDDIVHVRDPRSSSHKGIQLRGHSGDVLCLAFSNRGSLLASFGGDGTVRLWSLASEKQLVLHEHEAIDEIRFSETDDHLICSAAGQARLNLLQVHGTEHVTLRAEGGKFETGKMLDFSGDGRWLLAALSGELVVFELATLREVARVPFAHAHGAFFNSSGQILVSTDGGLFNYAIGSTPDLKQREDEPLELRASALAPDRQRSAVMHRNQVLVFEMSSMGLLSSNVVGRHYHHLALHPRGQWLAGMANGSEAIELWNLGERPAVAGPEITSASEYFAFDPTGRWLVTSRPGGFRMIEVGNWREREYSKLPRKEGAAPAGPIAVNTSGRLLAVAAAHHRIELWRIPRENERGEPELITSLEARNYVQGLTFSADGAWLGAITKDTNGALIELWNLKRLWAGLRPYLEKRFEPTS